jgi:transmembrane sensor
MGDLDREIARAREQVERPWSDERVERVGQALGRRRRSRRIGRGAAAILLVLAAGATAWRFAGRAAPSPWGDGVTVAMLDGGSLRGGPGGAELWAGAVRIGLADGRAFHVQVGGVSIDLSGAVVVLERGPFEVRVSVRRGRASVAAPDGRADLGAGEERRFRLSPAPPPAPPSPPATRALVEEPAAPPMLPRHERHPSHARPASGWRAPAEEGDFDRAYEELSRSGPRAVRDVPAELLLAADVTRLSHHPAEAVPLLERVARDHAADPRAPLAAFTLGRVDLDELGRPREAAAAFARARALAPQGPLASDALAREVESWSRAGETARARSLAEEYLRRWPKGARIGAVRLFGNLD